MTKDLASRVYDVIESNNLISKNDKVLVAVSGGPDSMTLITILNALKEKLHISLAIAHVNHKIRKEADEEKIYVENFAKSINVPFYYLEKDVISEAKKHKMGIEEYARKIRYDFFYELKEKYGYDKIAIAHNLNDKVETVLLNIIRGSSVKGLIGIKYKNDDIIRPLLDIKKEEVMNFCKDNNINPCIDKTNFDDTYTRNKVRLKLIPFIEKEFNPSFIEGITRLSFLAENDEEFIDEYVKKIVNESIISKENNNIIFKYENIKSEKIAVKSRFIKNIVEELLMNTEGLEKKHILDIIKLLDNNIKGKKYIIGNKFTIVILKKYVAKIYKNK